MGNVNIVKKEYKGWKNCIEISNGIVDLVATTDVGPRIIRFGFEGGANEFCEVTDQVGKTGGDKFNLFGGHRLWHSPEGDRTYMPDNSKIEWKKRKNGISLKQPVEEFTMIQKEMEITMFPDSSDVMVLHRLTNKGAWTVELSLWALSVMATGGKEIVPQTQRDIAYLPNRMLSLWPYAKMNDNRVYWGEKYITLKQDTSAKTAFKFGLPNEDGWAAYANHGNLFVKKFDHFDGALYPDYSASSYETYTNDFMLEMESLSPLVPLEPGDSIEHVETWSLHKGIKVPETEQDIDKYILPLVK